jgi:GTPase SAR1 family protein
MEVRPVKVVVIGSVGVGKTSVSTRFAFDNYNPLTESTLGAAYH